MPLPTAPFNSAKSIFAGLSVIQLKLSPQNTAVSAATDTLTFGAAHGYLVGQQLIYVSGTGFTGLTAGSTYYVVNVGSPTTLKLSATQGGAAITVGTSSAGVFQPVLVFEASQLDDDPSQDVKSLQRPDSKGVMRTVREVLIAQSEKWTYDLAEVKRLLDIFQGASSGRRVGTATIWVPDPDDASNVCSLKSEVDFACSVTRDGKVTHGNSDFSKTSIVIKSLKSGAIVWTPDGAP